MDERCFYCDRTATRHEPAGEGFPDMHLLVCENHRRHRVEAELYDAAGFRKSWVHPDGTSRLP